MARQALLSFVGIVMTKAGRWFSKGIVLWVIVENSMSRPMAGFCTKFAHLYKIIVRLKNNIQSSLAWGCIYAYEYTPHVQMCFKIS